MKKSGCLVGGMKSLKYSLANASGRAPSSAVPSGPPRLAPANASARVPSSLRSSVTLLDAHASSRCLGQFCIEAAPFAYSISFAQLPQIIKIFGLESDPALIEKARKKTSVTWGNKVSGDLILELMPKSWSIDEKAQVFTALSKSEKHSSEQSIARMNIKTGEQEMTSNPFSSLQVSALFFDPNHRRYFYVPLVIDKSNIRLAGMGVYTEAEIPKGSYGFYRGAIKSFEAQNGHYSWTINTWTSTGDQQTKVKYFKDATFLEHSNWARYVNCPNHGVKCNLVMKQSFHTVFYEAKEDILPGSELFIDYGDEYRQDNLGVMVKKYTDRARCLGPGGINGLGHLLARSQTYRVLEKMTLPMNCIFECTERGCKYFESDFFWCDGCEKAVLQEKFADACQECCTLSCRVCVRVWRHSHRT